MNISHNFMLLFVDNKPKLVNYKTKEEYHLNKEYLNELVSITESDLLKTEKKKIHQDFMNAGLLVSENDKPETYIHYYSNIFHGLSKDNSKTMDTCTEDEWAKKYIEISNNVAQVPLPERNSFKNYNTVIDLPVPKEPSIELLDTLMTRKTIREFDSTPVTQEQLSSVLFYSFGNIHETESEYGPFARRTSPSGGCLQIIEPYVCIFNVEGIENGIYWYDPSYNKLCLANKNFSYQNLRECLSGQFFGNNCAFGIFLTADLERLHWKYKTTRNYKVVFLEAGHFSQTSLLLGVSQNLKTWLTGALTESKVEKFCKIDGVKNIPVFFIAFGEGRNVGMHSAMTKKLEEFKNKKNDDLS